jgi:hypothetical protein
VLAARNFGVAASAFAVAAVLAVPLGIYGNRSGICVNPSALVLTCPFARVESILSFPASTRCLGSCVLAFLRLFGPGIFESNRPIEYELRRRAVFIQSEIAEALELIPQIVFGFFQRRFTFRCDNFQ